MQKVVNILIGLILAGSVQAQNRFSVNELSINGFRNPSIGAEFRHKRVSVHAGYYTTAFQAGEYTGFVKAGASVWFLPVGKKENPSSFYAGASYLRGLTRDYETKNALGLEAGFRWMVWKGLNVRLGGIALAAKGQSLRVNPTPGISYSIFFN